ncbi:MAG: hypothetical protein L3K09_01875, partial [Thermoplasmata archaeon]|nr:hypothetical protein [Thermoplasmata archaeon]
MFPLFWIVLYLPVAAWAATGAGLLVAARRSAPVVVLRLASVFLALWALLATTTLLWVVSHGGYPALWALSRSPLELFRSGTAGLWAAGAAGALVLLSVAFVLNQLVGHGSLALLEPSELPWPAALPRPNERTRLLSYESDGVD